MARVYPNIVHESWLGDSWRQSKDECWHSALIRSRGTENGEAVSDFQSGQVYNNSYYGYCWQTHGGFKCSTGGRTKDWDYARTFETNIVETHKLPCRCWGPAGTYEGLHLRQWRDSTTGRLWWCWQCWEVAKKKPRALGLKDFKRKPHLKMGGNRMLWKGFWT